MRRFAGWPRLRTLVAAILLVVPGCGWQGVNSLPLPGTEGGGPDSFEVQAQLPEVANIQRNSRVRVGDVTVGTITKIELQGWHALVTMRLDGDVELPENTVAKVGQTSLLGSYHIELSAPTDAAPQGRLHNGSVIPLSSASVYPSTEETLGAVAMLLNGGGMGQLQDITEAFSTAWANRGTDLRGVIEQFDRFVTVLDAQKDDITAAMESLNGLVSQLADQQPVLEHALATLPGALTVLADRRTELVESTRQLGIFLALASDVVNRSSADLAGELEDLAPVMQGLADAGSSMTRTLSLLLTYPYVKEDLHKYQRGDYGNLSAVVDLTLSRLDANLLTGTRFEGSLTELELQWGRTIGQLPSPYSAGNPLTVPYRMDQGK